ncbi:unnamed protein product [Peniophora sp. CBMAI 1063]|nr:unnamed protein product [Peniophora sp. CBMAI 1063]
MSSNESLPLSFLDLVKKCDNYRVPAPGSAALPRPLSFCLTSDGNTLGLLHPPVVDALLEHNAHQRSQSLPEHWVVELQNHRVFFTSTLTTPSARTRAMNDTTTWWRDSGRFPGVISPRLWRGEWYAIYADPFGPISLAGGDPLSEDDLDTNSNYVFSMERASCALFGVVTYGVHMTVYEQDDDGAIRVWVPRRSATKQTWPGLLDNSIAGGIPARSSPGWSMAKEAMEEGSIPEATFEKYAKAVGVISYFFQTSAGWLQPEVEYVYDMRVPSSESLKLSPGDNEVETFKLLPLDDVFELLHAGEFKPNCALVLIDFLIRLGKITPDNEPHYLDIQTRMHSRFEHSSW